MPQHLRPFVPGATYFFTLVTNFRRPILGSSRTLALLRQAIEQERQRHPFTIDAMVVLPDHLHSIWTLPRDDARFSMRWSGIKGAFSRMYVAAGGAETGLSASRQRRGERGIWQRRFWEHVIRDEEDYGNHMDYIHFNPVKHGLVQCAHAWPYSSFHRWVREGAYRSDWMCACRGRAVKSSDFGIEAAGE